MCESTHQAIHICYHLKRVRREQLGEAGISKFFSTDLSIIWPVTMNMLLLLFKKIIIELILKRKENFSIIVRLQRRNGLQRVAESMHCLVY